MRSKEQLDLANRIGNTGVRSQEPVVIRNPYDGEAVGTAYLATAEQLDEAIALASGSRRAIAGLPAERRAEIAERAARAISERAEELAWLITLESGKPIRYARVEVARAVHTFSLGAQVARSLGGEVVPVDTQSAGHGKLGLYRRVPRGVVSALSPFNFPLNLTAHKLSPALAVGAPVVHKPPHQSPLTALVLAQLLEDAGLPHGGLSALHCMPATAEVLATDARVATLSFTGSAKVGWYLQGRAVGKRVLLELGGNAPSVVDEGADVAAAVAKLSASAWANSGQVCIRAQRILVHESMFPDFLRQFVETARAIPCGDPRDPATVVGPLIDTAAVERVSSWLEEAQRGGATIHCGGTIPGNIVTPTVITNAPSSCRVYSEEVFAPVVVVEPFETFAEALRKANDSSYGLQASVFTPRIDRAMEAFDALEFGGVIINDGPSFRVDNAPYGGVKRSGLGREGVRWAAEEYSEAKWLVLDA